MSYARRTCRYHSWETLLDHVDAEASEEQSDFFSPPYFFIPRSHRKMRNNVLLKEVYIIYIEPIYCSTQ